MAVGDVYPSRGADAEVWRCRLWSENRLQGGREKLVLASAGEETAKEVLAGGCWSGPGGRPLEEGTL